MPDTDKDRERDKAVNRRAFHDYFVDEKYEAGMVLTGTEVKSIREGRCNLRDGFVRIDGNEAWLENVHISPYAQGNLMNHEPMRPRKLLLHRKQIASLIGKVRQKGYTLIPLRVYFARNRAKVVPEEALAPPAPPTPIVKPGTLRRDITKLQRENVPRDEAIHALQREVADLKAVIANICDQLGVNGPKQRSQKSA